MTDRAISAALRAVALGVALVPLAIGAFLVVAAWPALSTVGVAPFFALAPWSPRDGTFGILPMAAGTAVSSVAAVALAAPLGLAHALFTRTFAPRWLAAVSREAVSALAGVPSVVFGLVALVELVPAIRAVHPPGLGLLAAILVLAAMVLPTVAVTADAALDQVDPDLLVAARALGLGGWDALVVVVPAAWRPIRGGVLLALGRALGETMAVSMVAGNTIAWPVDPFRPFRTLTGHIAGEMAYATGVHRAALFVTGLVLLVAVAAVSRLATRPGRGFWVARWTPPGTPRGRDRVAAGILALGPLVVLAIVAGLAVDLAWRGSGSIDRWYLVSAPLEAGREGGIGPFLVATAWVLGLALLVAVPVGLATAVWLAEGAGREQRWIRVSLDVLAAVPSIVFGLFGLALFCELLGLGWSVLSGGLTVAAMILPSFVRLADDALRSVPVELRVAGAALGLPRWVVVARLVLPEAAPLLGAGLLLSTGRVLAESAALMFTAGGSIRTPTNPLEPGRVLAYHVWQLAIEVPGGVPRAYAAALVLLAVVWASAAVARSAPRWLLRRTG